MQDRHPHLRYSRGPTWLSCYLRQRMVAQGNALKDGRWIVVCGPESFERTVSTHDSFDAMFKALVAWARPYAWRVDHKPLGHPIAKGLRPRPS